eukprot:1497459-Rhodomonas_salina.1
MSCKGLHRAGVGGCERRCAGRPAVRARERRAVQGEEVPRFALASFATLTPTPSHAGSWERTLCQQRRGDEGSVDGVEVEVAACEGAHVGVGLLPQQHHHVVRVHLHTHRLTLSHTHTHTHTHTQPGADDTAAFKCAQTNTVCCTPARGAG